MIKNHNRNKVNVYLTKRSNYSGSNKISVPFRNEFGTVREILHASLSFVNNWIYTLSLICGHTKKVLHTSVRCWTTHTRCNKCKNSE